MQNYSFYWNIRINAFMCKYYFILQCILVYNNR